MAKYIPQQHNFCHPFGVLRSDDLSLEAKGLGCIISMIAPDGGCGHLVTKDYPMRVFQELIDHGFLTEEEVSE